MTLNSFIHNCRHLPFIRQVSPYSHVLTIAASLIISTTVSIFTTSLTAANIKGEQENSKYLLYVDSADMFLTRERWSQAEDMIRKALRSSPANPLNALLFSNLGVALTEQNKYDEALQAFEIALIRSPKSANTYSARGRTFLKLNNSEAALNDFSTALNLDSTLLSTREMRAHLLLIDRRIDEAQKDYLYFMRHNPADASGPYGLGQCAELNSDFENAIRYYKDADLLEQDIDNQADIAVALARVLILSDRLNEADETVRQGLKRHPRYGMLYLTRAWLHHLRFQTEEEKIDKKLAREYGVEPQIIDLYFPQ